MPARLSDAEIAHYRSEGYVKGIRVLEPAEIDELRELYPVNHEALKTRALERWINEQRREHDVYAVFNSDIYAWMIQQLGISTAITPSPQPANPFQQFLGGS